MLLSLQVKENIVSESRGGYHGEFMRVPRAEGFEGSYDESEQRQPSNLCNLR